MRKLVAVFIVCLLFAGTIQSVFGSGIDNKTNWSVGYARTMNRNAVYDSVDAAVYNPAGIGRFDSGLFIGANNQSIFINYSHESAAELYEAKNPTLFLPSAFVIYKRARLGFYGAFYVPAGGGRLKYDDSIVDLSEDLGLAPFDPSAELFGVYYAGTAGVVYALNDMLSVSLGGRFICAKQTTKFETDTVMSGFPVGPFSGFNGETLVLDTKATAMGFDAIIGLNLSPISGLNIGIRYETNTPLEWEYTEVSGHLATLQGIAEGDKYKRDLPALLGIGASYMVLPKLRVEASLDLYLNKSADWDGEEDDVKTGYAFGAAAEYAFLETLKASAGFLYTKTGADQETYLHLNPALNSVTLCGGALYRVNEKLSVELGVMKPFYSEDEGVSIIGSSPVDIDKSLWIIAVGAQYKIF